MGTLVERFALEQEVLELRSGALESVVGDPPDDHTLPCVVELASVEGVTSPNSCVREDDDRSFASSFAVSRKHAASWAGCAASGGYFSFKPTAVTTDEFGSFTSRNKAESWDGHSDRGGFEIRPRRASAVSENSPKQYESGDVGASRLDFLQPLPPRENPPPPRFMKMCPPDEWAEVSYDFVVSSEDGEGSHVMSVSPLPSTLSCKRRKKVFRGMCLFGRGTHRRGSAMRSS